MANEATTNISLILVLLAITVGISIPAFYLFVSKIRHKRLYSRNRLKINELIDSFSDTSITNNKK